MAPFRAKKRFSQNFLVDQGIAERIVDFLHPDVSDTVFEIGGGQGALTERIARSGARVYSFEIDRDLISILREKVGRYENSTVVGCDFLKVSPGEYTEGKFKLIGNIPYDITSPVLDWIVQNRSSISLAVITAQLELAERICASPGGKEWAPISIFSQFFFDIKMAMHIAPKSFYPPPQVRSAVMIFSPAEKYNIGDWRKFEGVVRGAFRQRRKLLRNNLSDLPGISKDDVDNVLEGLGLAENIRAEQISIEEFIKLAEALPNIT